MRKMLRIMALCLCAALLGGLLVACGQQTSDKTKVEIWHNWNVEEGGTEYILKVLVDEYNAS